MNHISDDFGQEEKIRKFVWLMDIYYDRDRYLDGDIALISIDFKNISERDMYIDKIGYRIKWLEPGIWTAYLVRETIRAGDQHRFELKIQIPYGIPLGEYAIEYGIEFQYLPADRSLQVQWTNSSDIINIKHLPKIKIFVSHSTENMVLVRRLQKDLDEYGVGVILADDIKTPGENNDIKIQELINSSDIFLALLTEEGINSPWVIKETDYAISINKPRILLKEKNVVIRSTIEWTEFSKNESDKMILIVNDAINYHLENTKVPKIHMQIYDRQIQPIQLKDSQNNLKPFIVVAVMAFLLGTLVNE